MCGGGHHAYWDAKSSHSRRLEISPRYVMSEEEREQEWARRALTNNPPSVSWRRRSTADDAGASVTEIVIWLKSRPGIARPRLSSSACLNAAW